MYLKLYMKIPVTIKYHIEIVPEVLTFILIMFSIIKLLDLSLVDGLFCIQGFGLYVVLSVYILFRS